MLPQFLPAFVATAIALIAGGSLAGLSRRIAWWPVGLASIAAQLLMMRIPVADVPWLGTGGHWVWVMAIAAVLLVLLRNLRIETGWGRLPWLVAALGVALNLLVIVTNGGYMPVSTEALQQTGQSAALQTRSTFHRDIVLDQTTQLPWLADVFADPAWAPHPVITSVGDRFLSLGLAGWAFLSVFRAGRYAARANKAGDDRQAVSQGSTASADSGLLAR